MLGCHVMFTLFESCSLDDKPPSGRPPEFCEVLLKKDSHQPSRELAARLYGIVCSWIHEVDYHLRKSTAERLRERGAPNSS
ncbi:hypothetical protein Y032_0266g686 [Ancylostoma ceylanicum]|uniref:Uncharacterized protein n=1 Tax=Ancylostoma ceylanicum TaxID=53326 RepID=A0A016S9W9_9BILA|nr:hypothetical protein Y032_0266g686 [Ancylostoma ceylanicum]